MNKKKFDIYFAIALIIFCFVPILFQIDQEQKILIEKSPTYNIVSILYPNNQTKEIPDILKNLDPHVETDMVYALSSIKGNISNNEKMNFNGIFSDNLLNMLNHSNSASDFGENSNQNDTWGINLQAGRIPQNKNEILIQYEWWQQLASEGKLPDNLSLLQKQPKLWNLSINLVYNFLANVSKLPVTYTTGGGIDPHLSQVNLSYSSTYNVVGVVKINDDSIMSELLSYYVDRSYTDIILRENLTSTGGREYDKNAPFIFGDSNLSRIIDFTLFPNVSVGNNEFYAFYVDNYPVVISFISYFPRSTSLSLKDYWMIFNKINHLDLHTSIFHSSSTNQNTNNALYYKGDTLFQFYLSEFNQLQEFGRDWSAFDIIYLPLLGALLLFWMKIRWNQRYNSLILILNMGESPGVLFRKQSIKMMWEQILLYGISIPLLWFILDLSNVSPMLTNISLNIYLTRMLFIIFLMIGMVFLMGFDLFKKISQNQTGQEISFTQLLFSRKKKFTQNFTQRSTKTNRKQNDKFSEVEKKIQKDINLAKKQKKRERWSNFGFIFIIIELLTIILIPILLENTIIKPLLAYRVGIIEILVIISFAILTPILIIRKWGPKIIKMSIVLWNKKARLNNFSKQLYTKIFSKIVISDKNLLIMIAFGIIGMLFFSGWTYSLEWMHSYQTESTTLRLDNSDIMASGIPISNNFTISSFDSMLQNNCNAIESQFMSIRTTGSVQGQIGGEYHTAYFSWINPVQYLSYVENNQLQVINQIQYNQSSNSQKSSLTQQFWSGFINAIENGDKYCIMSGSTAKYYNVKAGDTINVIPAADSDTKFSLKIYAVVSSAPLLYLDDPNLGNIRVILPFQLWNNSLAFSSLLSDLLAIRLHGSNQKSSTFQTNETAIAHELESYGVRNLYLKNYNEFKSSESEIIGKSAKIYDISEFFNSTEDASVITFILHNQSYVIQNIVGSAIFVIAIFINIRQYLFSKFKSEEKRLIFLGETDHYSRKILRSYEAFLFGTLFAICFAFSILTNYLLDQIFILHVIFQIQYSNHGGLIGLLLTKIPYLFYWINKYSQSAWWNPIIPFINIKMIFFIVNSFIFAGFALFFILGFRRIMPKKKEFKNVNLRVNKNENVDGKRNV